MLNLARTPDHPDDSLHDYRGNCGDNRYEDRPDGRLEALVAAFTAAEYIVDAPEAAIVIRVGEKNPGLDRLLGERPWAVITAHNPDGRACSAESNSAAQRVLEQDLRRSRPSTLLPVCNRDPAGNWPDEPAWLFTPRTIEQADRLAQRFGQRAILAGFPGAAAQLRIYGASHDAPGTAPGTAP